MKHALLTSTLLLLLGSLSHAQDFEQLRPNASPAYMILGVSPTEMERPTTPKEFIAGIQAASVNGRLAPNFTMEFTPYELLSSERKDPYKEKAKKYLMDDGYGMNLVRSLAISVATSESDTVVLGRLGSGTSASLGVKVLLCHGRMNKSTKEALQQLTRSFKQYTVIRNTVSMLRNMGPDETVTMPELDKLLEDRLTFHRDSVSGNNGLTRQERDEALTELEALVAHAKDLLENALRDRGGMPRDEAIGILNRLASQPGDAVDSNLAIANKRFAFVREGDVLEANAAFMGHFVQNSWDSIQAAKYAIWLTPSYRLNLAKKKFDDVMLLDFIGLVRYTGNNMMVDTASYLDMGAKLQFTFNKLTMSAEYVGRILPEYKNASGDIYYTDRITGSLEYVVNNLITLRASFGRTFDGNSAVYDSPSDALYGMGGLALSFLNNQGL